MSDTNEAIARLREAAEASTEYRLSNVTTKVNDLLVLLAEHAALEAAHAEALDALEDLTDIVPNNLRALLDAHAALETAHTEALDALEAIRRRATTPAQGRWVDGVFHRQLSDTDVRAAKAEADAADAVLAKAGRR